MLRSFAFTLLFCTWAAPGLSAEVQSQLIYAFRNYTRPEPQKMILVGEITSKTKAAILQKVDATPGYDVRPDQITVKVLNPAGLKVGQKLYVIDKDPFHTRYRNGLIVGEVKVEAILQSKFYGDVLTASGILLRVREGHFVARTLGSENLEEAMLLKREGDYYLARQDTARALQAYKKALLKDADLPEAHAALGALYLGQSLKQRTPPVQALGEFALAWKNRDNFNYKNDKYQFYQDYLEALHEQAQVRLLEGGRSRPERIEEYLGRLFEVARAVEELIGQKDRQAQIQLLRGHYLRTRLYLAAGSPLFRARYDESQRMVDSLLQELAEGPGHKEVYRIAALSALNRAQQIPCAEGQKMESEIRQGEEALRQYFIFQTGPAQPLMNSLPAEFQQARRRCSSAP
ncbi:MAG: hypothetical protein HS115_12945 [Spirochaetales bacterium]|nr:hypothetical protein [Spirochaetales bacterium]